METMMQMSLGEYNELLKTKKEYEDKKNEYEQKIVKEGLIKFEYTYNIGCRTTDFYYQGKDDTIKHLKDELHNIEKEKEDIEKKYHALKKVYKFSDRIRILFIGIPKSYWEDEDD